MKKHFFIVLACAALTACTHPYMQTAQGPKLKATSQNVMDEAPQGPSVTMTTETVVQQAAHYPLPAGGSVEIYGLDETPPAAAYPVTGPSAGTALGGQFSNVTVFPLENSYLPVAAPTVNSGTPGLLTPSGSKPARRMTGR